MANQAPQLNPAGALPISTFSTKILTNHVLYDLVFEASSPGSLFRLRRTCRPGRTAVDDYLPRAFKINSHFERFFDNPEAFRSLQARTATLVSGSSALQFFNRTTYEGSDLDLYTYYQHRQEVGQWLIQNGYVFQPNSMQDSDPDTALRKCVDLEDLHDRLKYHMKGVASVFTFTKPSPKDASEKLQVQVVVASSYASPMAVILNFHSTVVFNVISWDRAYSLYPRATFEDHRALYLRPDYTGDEDENEIVHKYEARGWSFRSERAAFDNDRAFGDRARWIGDRQSWVINLDLTGVALPPPINESSRSLSRDPCCLTSWWLRPEQERWSSYNPAEAIACLEGNKFTFYRYVSLPASWAEVCKYLNTIKKYVIIQPGKPYLDAVIVDFVEAAIEHEEKWRRWPSLPPPSDDEFSDGSDSGYD